MSPPGCGVWFPRPGHQAPDGPSLEQGPLKPVMLFDIEKDPEEKNEVSKLYPGVVDYLLARLNQYQRSAVPIIYPDEDPKCDPGPTGVWGPWA